jgi:hypothetical protein
VDIAAKKPIVRYLAGRLSNYIDVPSAAVAEEELVVFWRRLVGWWIDESLVSMAIFENCWPADGTFLGICPAGNVIVRI